MKLLRSIFFCVVVWGGVVSCDSGDPMISSEPAIADYFPLKTRSYFLYDVDETKISQNVSTREVYELKVSVADSFRNGEGNYTYVLRRMKRATANAAWTPIDTWSAAFSSGSLILNEGGTLFVSLVSPASADQEWDGNALNTLGGEQSCGNDSRRCDTYKVASVGSAISVGSQTFEHGLSVVENDDPERFVRYDVRKVTYAKGVGLVDIQREVLNYCTSTQACYGKQFVDNGYRYAQTLKAYGKE